MGEQVLTLMVVFGRFIGLYLRVVNFDTVPAQRALLRDSAENSAHTDIIVTRTVFLLVRPDSAPSNSRALTPRAGVS